MESNEIPPFWRVPTQLTRIDPKTMKVDFDQYVFQEVWDRDANNKPVRAGVFMLKDLFINKGDANESRETVDRESADRG